MSKSLTSSKKSKKFLSIVYGDEKGKQETQFLRSYSQLINSHLSVAKKQKSHQRRISLSSHNFRSKSLKKLNHNNGQINGQKAMGDIFQNENNNLSQSFELSPSNQTIKKASTKILLNPESLQKIQKIIMSKAQKVQIDSYNNVVLNEKLHNSNKQKNDLIKEIQNLKRQIANQKKMKMKISLGLGKVMNKNQQAYNNLIKVQKEKTQIGIEIQTIMQSNRKGRRINQKRKNLSDQNTQKIQIQEQLIASLQNQIVKNKIALSETKTHLNQLKSIYTYQSKVLSKLKMIFQGITDQRDKMCNVVHSSVYEASQSYKK